MPWVQELPASEVCFDANPARQVQVLSNLLNYSAKYTPVGGRNPFDNQNTQRPGSRDGTALDAGVELSAADPVAVAWLAYDGDLAGLIVLRSAGSQRTRQDRKL